MDSLLLSLSLIVASSVFPVHALPTGGDDGHLDGHLGTTWEVIVAVSLALLLFVATTTIIIVTIRRRRRNREQEKHSNFAYASHAPPTFMPSMPYGISRPSSVYQPRDKHGRKVSPDRISRLRESP